MHKTSRIFVPALALSLAACSSSSEGTGPGNPLPECKTGSCGKESFRRAVPTRSEVRVGHPTGSSSSNARAARTARTGTIELGKARTAALEAISPALLAVDQEITEIDAVVDEIFAELEASASTTPEVETDTEHRWRVADPELSGYDDVLRITSADGVRFAVDYYVVPAGAEPDATDVPVVSGEVRLADADALDFELEVDLDAFATVDPTYPGRGAIVVAAMPLAGGLSEHWFDFHAVSFDGGTAQTSRTTAWAFAEDSAAIELVADFGGAQATVYARWDAGGGRYDHHVEYVDPDVGLVDEIATNCWSATGREDFDAWAVIDQALAYYGELEGDEAACPFGPVADHPNPSAEFDNLPEDGEWALLELLSWCEVSSEC